ncbi:MAG TPA: hypothetical protein VN688_12295 [Gemmataceae bacterium]|nr:hypothetical protein [Gemmataceae bacterium]
MTTVNARFDGRAFVLENPVDLPVGCAVEISFTLLTAPPSPERPLAALVEIADLFPDNPDSRPDLAAQHDHYLYGLPK